MHQATLRYSCSDAATANEQPTLHLTGSAWVVEKGFSSRVPNLPKDQAWIFQTLHQEETIPLQGDIPAVGSEILGYLLLAELGRGSFGRVFLARQLTCPGRLVVLKLADDVREETQILAQLRHPNIVPVDSVLQSGRFQAVCMPFLGATTLEHVLQRLKNSKQLPSSGEFLQHCLKSSLELTEREPVSKDRSAKASSPGLVLAPAQSFHRQGYVETVLWMGARLADGLAHAHTKGVVHRDLKPANILLSDSGQPMLLDFNLAQDIRSQRKEELVGGTLAYMAPEQIAAFRDGSVSADPRSDLYALGIVLTELLTGRHPFPVKDNHPLRALDQAMAERQQAPPALCCFNAAVPPAVESILCRCLNPNPGQRYQSADELRKELERQNSNCCQVRERKGHRQVAKLVLAR